MDSKEKETVQWSDLAIVRMLKAAVYTFLLVVLIDVFMMLVFSNMAAEQSNTYAIISFCIGIIFTIFYCTFTIIQEIRKKN